MPGTTITISGPQRDGLYELVRNHLGSVGDLWDALEQKKDFATASRLGLEFGEDFSLLEDIGWGQDEGRESFELTMPVHDLMELLKRLHGEAEQVLAGKGTERQAREDERATEDRYLRGLDACEELLPVVTNIRGRFQDQLDRILEMVGADPALFFIDPFGMDGAALPVIDRILERRSKTVTELLINFSHRGFQRMAGNLDASAQSPAAKAAARTKVESLNAILDTTFWQGAWRNPDLTPEQKLDRVADWYAERLRARGIEEVHPIHMRDSWDSPTAYRMFFATRSPHGVYLMSDIVAAYERGLFQQRFEGTFELQWETERRTRAMDELRDEVHAFGLASQGARPIDVFLHFAPIHFGEWTQTDYMNCLRELVRRGGIQRNGSSGIKQREMLTFAPIAQADLFGTGAG